VRYRRKKFTFAISSPDEFLLDNSTGCFQNFTRSRTRSHIHTAKYQRGKNFLLSSNLIADRKRHNKFWLAVFGIQYDRRQSHWVLYALRIYAAEFQTPHNKIHIS